MDATETFDPDDPRPVLDWAAGAELTGCTPKQVLFAKAIVAGANKTRAAIAAGYKGKDSTLRSAASRIAKSLKVRALLEWARLGGAGPSDTPGSLEELKKILWRHARAKDDPGRSIKATEVLHRIEAAELERAAAEGVSFDPIATLNELAGLSPFLAQWLAQVHGITWNVPPISIEKALAELEDVRKQVLVNAAKPNGAARDVGSEIEARPAP